MKKQFYFKHANHLKGTLNKKFIENLVCIQSLEIVNLPVSMVYISDHFASRRPSKTFSIKILLDNAMAQLSKKKKFKNCLRYKKNNSFKGFKFLI